MLIFTVSTCIPDQGERPLTPFVFAKEAEALAHLEETLRQEWEGAGVEDDDGNALPYPGDWQAANDAIAAHYDDGSWGGYLLSSHQVATPHDAPDAAPAAPQMPATGDSLSLAEHIRLARRLIGTDHIQGRNEARVCLDNAERASALMLAALKTCEPFIRSGDVDSRGGKIELSRLANIMAAAITAAEGREG